MSIPAWLDAVLDQEVHRVIANDPRTTQGTFLGWPRNRIFNDVIGGGQAEFDQPIGMLGGDDRALLYAKYNQKGHLDELCHAFGMLFLSPPIGRRFTVIDLGCGPFTAGLSLAAVIGADHAFRYYGVDQAQSMLRLGLKLADAAKSKGGIHGDTTCFFSNNLHTLNFGRPSGELVVIVASYLLASPTLNISELVNSLVQALSNIGQGPAAFLYTNSGLHASSRKYSELKEALINFGFSVRIEETEYFAQTKNARDVHYALFYREADLSIRI